MTILHSVSLNTLFHEAFTDVKEQYGHENLLFHRVDLHHELVALALNEASADSRDDPQVSLHSGKRVVAIDCDAGTLQLKSGEVIENDLIVVADGAHSDLFSQFTGSPDPVKRSGRSLYRILLDRNEVLSNPQTACLFTSFPDSTSGMILALDPIEDTLLVTYPCRNNRTTPILNIAIVHNTRSSPESSNESADESWQTPATLDETLETLHNFHPDLKALVSLVARPIGTDKQTNEDENYDIKIHHGMVRPPLDSFVRGKAVVMGDAAHLMISTHAAGASVAIESTGALGVLMRDVRAEKGVREVGAEVGGRTGREMLKLAEVIHERLKIFDSLRVPRCTTLQILSNNGFMSQARPEVVERIRQHGYHDWLPGPSAGPYGEDYRRLYFNHDACAEAEVALKRL